MITKRTNSITIKLLHNDPAKRSTNMRMGLLKSVAKQRRISFTGFYFFNELIPIDEKYDYEQEEEDINIDMETNEAQHHEEDKDMNGYVGFKFGYYTIT